MTDSDTYIGPSVYEAAEMRIRQINRTIEELIDERRMCARRLVNSKWRNMLESERLATQAEPFQTTQLPE